MALTVPTTSSVTEPMISDWMTRFQRDRDSAISELLQIENAQVDMPTNLPQSVYGELQNRYYGALDRLPSGQRDKPLGRAAIAAGAIMTAVGIFAGIVFGNPTGNTPIAGYSHVTSTINPSSLHANAATSSFISAQVDVTDSVVLGDLPAEWGQVATSVQITPFVVASGTIQVLFSNFNTSGTAYDLPSGVLGLDIWRH